MQVNEPRRREGREDEKRKHGIKRLGGDGTFRATFRTCDRVVCPRLRVLRVVAVLTASLRLRMAAFSRA
jgi:hypothetical protein